MRRIRISIGRAPAPVVECLRTVFDADGYELPFGKCKADRLREEARARQKEEGVRVVMPTSSAGPQWHPASQRRLQQLEQFKTVGGGGDEERIQAALARGDVDGETRDGEQESFDAQFTSLAEHDVEMRRSRMANIRSLVEGVPIINAPRDPFNGFFLRRDGLPPEVAEKPLVSVEDLDQMLQELSHMVFPPDDEDAIHEAGCEEYYGVADLGHADKDAAAAAEQQRPKRRSMTQERGMRAPYVSDEVERKLLICVCLQHLTQRLTTNDRQRPLKLRTTSIDKFGRSPSRNTAEARAAPQLYMRYGLDDNGTDVAFRVLEQILEADAEQHYEAIRYHAELACVSGQLWRLQDTVRLSRGWLQPDGVTPRGRRDPVVRESSEIVCRELMASTVSEYVLRHVMEHVMDENGEGSAAKALLDLLRDICYITGQQGSRLIIETLIDDVDAVMSTALKHYQTKDHDPEAVSTISPTEVALRFEDLKATDKHAMLLMQSATAVFKTLVGTELPLVVDPVGVMQLNCYAKLFITLREQKRVHESWGTAESMLSFYDKYRESLAADFADQVKTFEQQIREETGIEIDVSPKPMLDPFGGDLNSASSDAPSPSLRMEEGDAPDYENPYSELMRKVWVEYCSDRAKESAIFGKKIVLRAIEQRYPESNELYRILGACHHRLGEHEEALSAATRAIELNPCDPHGHMLLAALLWGAGRYLEARREQRLADVVNQLIFNGQPVSAEDLRLANAALRALDERRALIAKEEETALREVDDQSHKFFAKERAAAIDALVIPDTEHASALLPPLASAIVRDLANMVDNDGNREFMEWKAHMAASHRYSKFFSVPRFVPEHHLDIERVQEHETIRGKNALVPEEWKKALPPTLY